MLTKRLAIYIPSKIGQEDIPAQEREFWLKNTLTELSRRYGGATAIDGYGCWLSTSGELVMERVTIAYTFADQDADAASVYELARRLATALKQEAVAIEIDGAMDFVVAATEEVAA